MKGDHLNVGDISMVEDGDFYIHGTLDIIRISSDRVVVHDKSTYHPDSCTHGEEILINIFTIIEMIKKARE